MLKLLGLLCKSLHSVFDSSNVKRVGVEPTLVIDHDFTDHCLTLRPPFQRCCLVIYSLSGTGAVVIYVGSFEDIIVQDRLLL